MLVQTFALAALPMLVAAQTTANDLKRAALLDRVDAEVAASYAEHVVDAPAIVDALQRVALRLGAGTPSFRLTRNAQSEAHEPVPAGRLLFVPEELVRRVKDDDELAGMLAHALAHAERGPVVLDMPNGSTTVPMVFVAWPSTEGALIPSNARAAIAELELQADAAAVNMLGRAGIDASGLLRYLERAKVSEARLSALRNKITNVTADAAAPPLTSECDVIQAFLDELAGKRAVPTLRR